MRSATAIHPFFARPPRPRTQALAQKLEPVIDFECRFLGEYADRSLSDSRSNISSHAGRGHMLRNCGETTYSLLRST